MKNLPIIRAVFCPWTHQLHDIGLCADCCDHYSGDGQDIDGMKCNYVEHCPNEPNYSWKRNLEESYRKLNQ
jgi:hypothetical protein